MCLWQCDGWGGVITLAKCSALASCGQLAETYGGGDKGCWQSSSSQQRAGASSKTQHNKRQGRPVLASCTSEPMMASSAMTHSTWRTPGG
jgi:hypothetical protein